MCLDCSAIAKLCIRFKRRSINVSKLKLMNITLKYKDINSDYANKKNSSIAFEKFLNVST